MYRRRQIKYLVGLIELAAEIYNHCIGLHKRYYRAFGKHLNKAKLQLHITKQKKLDRYAHWSKLGSQAIQEITERIANGYTLFFRNVKRKIRSGPPSFKRRAKYKSFTLKQAGYRHLGGNSIQIAGRTYKYAKSREIEGRIKRVTIKRDSIGDIYIYIVSEATNGEKPVRIRTGKSVGYDFGLTTYLKASEGNDIESPQFFKESQSRIRKLNRELSRKQKGSKHRGQAKRALAKEHIRTANRRKDFQFKQAKELCKTYDLICIEDLNIKAMQMMWGRKISDLSHSSFVGILKQQAAKYGAIISEIPRFYPSSKTCSNCGYVLDELPLKVRSWTCPDCKATHDRDYNAAVNIQRVGASTLGGDTVIPSLGG